MNGTKHICIDQNLSSTERHRQGGRISFLTFKKMGGNGPRNIKVQCSSAFKPVIEFGNFSNGYVLHIV